MHLGQQVPQLGVGVIGHLTRIGGAVSTAFILAAYSSPMRCVILIGIPPFAAAHQHLMGFPRWLEAGDLIHVEEYREDGTLVVRADLPGIDPDKDVELTVAGGMLHIQAERRQEEKREDKGHLRREVRYGSLSRSLPLPEGVTEADITATTRTASWRSASRNPSTKRPGR